MVVGSVTELSDTTQIDLRRLKMRTRSKLLITASLLAVGLLAWPIAGDETREANQSQKLEELLKKRQSTLRQLVAVVTAEYRNGTTGFESVARATNQLIDAELDSAKNADARTAILQRRVELMKSLFSMVETRFKAGQVTEAKVLVAKAGLLESQIQLAREQADGGKPQQ